MHLWNVRSVLGILGNGQLAMMLAEAAGPLGLKVLAYGGRLDDDVALEAFFAKCETVVFENEFVDCGRLAHLGKKVSFVPGLDVIRDLQDKLKQKAWLTRLNIATAPWLPMTEPEPQFLANAKQRFPAGFVLKWARMGYDGKGVLVGGEGRGGEAFCAEAAKMGVPVFAEERIAFRRELAMVAAYSVNGEFTAYPLVISVQREGICRTVQGPAKSLGVPAELEFEARSACEKLARSIPLHGAFALEFFETDRGKLIVNEIAPRVHNTGHYTQDCARASQFENHWRSVLGMPLGDATTEPAFAMVNLIGPPGATELALPEVSGAGKLHWYGKAALRPGRKMGHLNGIAATLESLPALVNALEERRMKWESLQK